MNLSLAIKAVQEKLGLDPDGLAGPATWRAIHLAVVGKPYNELPAAEIHGGGVAIKSDHVDVRSETNIATLLPTVQPYARALVHAAADQHIIIKIIDGSRTYEQQDALYEKGRHGNPGPVVTNARGGQSNHCFGIAFDFGVFDESGKYLPESPAYKVVGALARTIGLEWGGDWRSIVDEPHVQLNPKGYTVAQMRERVAAGQSVLA